ncbi:hypothetical protein HanRHA438_Chr09g0413281 [Helianthus annuus]|nr:hypothetical protein HanIR_Chr09g0432481 [Helianthus annuus]KAJ0889476.1 hypothetical protein HanRHA438_Chr09g0413281 [Helianthus annuus]
MYGVKLLLCFFNLCPLVAYLAGNCCRVGSLVAIDARLVVAGVIWPPRLPPMAPNTAKGAPRRSSPSP